MKLHPGACDEVKAFNVRTKSLKASFESIKEVCGKSKIYLTFVDGMSDADMLASSMLESRCGIKEEVRYTNEDAGSGWSYRGKILIPVGLILVLVIWLGRMIFR